MVQTATARKCQCVKGSEKCGNALYSSQQRSFLSIVSYCTYKLLVTAINSCSIVDMELSSDVVNGLKLVADTAKIPDKYFVILLKDTINTLVESKRFEPPHGTLHCVYIYRWWACPANRRCGRNLIENRIC